MNRAVLAIVCALLVAGSASAECVQCPSPPCEIQQCPPNDVEVFAELKIGDVKTGLGHQVEIFEGVKLKVSALTDAGGRDADIDMTVEADDPSLLEGQTFYLEVEKFALVNGQWQYTGSELDPDPLFYSPMGIGVGDCALMEEPCDVGQQGECASDSCQSAAWCEDFCLIAIGWCVDQSAQCAGCSTNDLTCPSMDDETPLPTLRKQICPESTSKCRFKVINVSEG